MDIPRRAIRGAPLALARREGSSFRFQGEIGSSSSDTVLDYSTVPFRHFPCSVAAEQIKGGGGTLVE